MKEQVKNSPDQTNEEEVGSLPEKNSESPIQDKYKEKQAKTHINQTIKN